MAVSANDIQGLYIAYFNRPADYLGLQFWTDAANKAGGINTVANAFAASSEYTTLYAGKSTAQIIDTIYMNLFGRHAELDGIKFWGSALDNKVLGIGNIAYQIMKGAQDTVGGDQDATAVASKVAAATAFYNSLDTAAEVIAYSGDTANALVKTWLSGITDQATLDAATTTESLDAITASVVTAGTPVVPPQTITLTTGIDSVVGGAGNDVFNAVPSAGVNTLSALDKLDGGAGNDTLNIVSAAGLSLTTMATGATIKNIETVNLTSPGAITAADVSGWTGVTQLNLNSATGTSGVVAAATTNVSELGSIAASTITGGKNVTVVHTTAGDVTSDQAAGSVNITSSAGNVIVTKAAADVTVVAQGTINAGGTSLNASIGKAVTYATQVADVAAAAAAVTAATKATAADTAAGTLVTDLATMNAAIAASTTVAATNAATLVALKAGEITLAQKVAIDAAFSAGLVTSAAAAQAAALTVYTPITTAATVAKAATAAAVTTTTAASTAAAAVVTADVVAAGTGFTVTDTVNTALASATVSGNYNAMSSASPRVSTVGTTITDSSTSNTTLTSVTLDNGAAAALSGNGLTKVTLTNYVNNVTLTNTTLGHADTLNLTSVKGTTFADAAAATVNLVSNGTATNTLSLTAGVATAVNISGAAGVTLTADTLAANAVITATNAGKNTLTIGAAQSYVGGAGGSVVTTNGGTVQSAAVSGGSGTADKLILANATDFGTTAAKALFTGFEVLQVNAIAADVSKFTGSTITSEVINGAGTLTGLTAAQAGKVGLLAGGAITVGVTGASTVGQIDTVHLTNADTAAITLTAPNLAGVEILTLSTGAGLTVSSLANALALTNVNVDGAGDVAITADIALNVNTIIDAHTATGAVTVNASTSSANGLKIVGSTTGANTLTSNALASVLVGGDGGDILTGGAAADSITSGNGNNTIAGGGGADTIIVGNGHNTISGFSGGTVTAGNGFNTITGGAGNDTITVGTGGNIITGAAGADTIKLGAHVAGVVDTIIYTTNATSAAAAGANMDTLNGFISGQDTIQLQISVATDATSTNGLKDAAAVVVGNVHTASVGTMAAVITDATSVATTAAVYTALATDLAALAASTAAAGGIHAQVVTFTTGAAAGTYLIINDANTGFDVASDTVIKLVGGTTVTAADFSYKVVA
jgi:S-layer protein